MENILPIENGYITSGFGWRILDGIEQHHGGLDVSSYCKLSHIILPVSGIVYKKGFSESFGWRIWIKSGISEYYVLAHMSSLLNSYKIGDNLLRCTVVGIMGNTGWSQAPHCHWEFRTHPDKPLTAFLSPYQIFPDSYYKH